jgi:NAD(P)-dependent dehydrogenase (short-subunit alcohol dehydrogenase family)
MKEVAGKVAFITGGVSGIGWGIAKAFALAAMKVVITYRRQDHLDQAMAWFKTRPELAVHAIKLDVTDREGMKRAADAVQPGAVRHRRVPDVSGAHEEQYSRGGTASAG